MKKNTFLTLVLILISMGNFFAADIYVSSAGNNSSGDGSEGNPYLTIGKAHTEATSGDKIIITGSLIHNALLAITKNITIEGNSDAVLEADGSRSGTNRMFFVGTAGLTVTFKNLTLQNHTGTTLAGAVFGMNISSDVTFENCTFIGNSTSSRDGGSIFFSNGNVTITSCSFLNNSAGTNQGGSVRTTGGTGVLTVTNSLFNGNTAGRGGAISLAGNNRQLVMSGCTFVNNSATTLDGGAIYLTGTNATSSITNTTIYNNSVTYTTNQSKGGGIRIEGIRPFTIQNSLIYGNTATNGTTTVISDIGAISNLELTLTNSITQLIAPAQTGTGDDTSTSKITANLTNSNLSFVTPNVTFTAPSAVTDDTPIDFGSDSSDIGSWDSKINIFEATTNNVWNEATNWSNGALPTSTDNVAILTGAGCTLDTAASIVDLKVVGSFKINANQSLIVTGSSEGNVSYKRTLSDVAGGLNGWYLMTSPVAGVTFNDDYVSNYDIAISGDGDRAIAIYTTSSNSWSYLQSGASLSSTSGVGYSVKIDPDGVTTAPEEIDGLVLFDGTINTTDISPSISTAANGFNLLGVPYTSYINSGTFLTENTNLDAQIWLYKHETAGGGNYEVKTSGENYMLAPGQGFFVKANSGSTVNFTKSNQALTGEAFQKSSRTELKLLMSAGARSRFAKLYFLEDATLGFDNGWEGETFGGIKNKLDVFTQLVSQNQGKSYQVQSLPISDINELEIPIGIIAEANKEIYFTLDKINLPTGLKVFLEDREKNIFTQLDLSNSEYKIITEKALDGVGRFYLHTSSKALNTDYVSLDNIKIFKSDISTISMNGLPQGKTNFKLFNILGKQVMNKNFESYGVKDFIVPELAKGIYIIHIENNLIKLTKKIIFN